MGPSCPQLSCAGSMDETDIDTHRSGCPQRQKPPPVPNKLPYAAHGENRSKLQKYLLDYYLSSTFNTCEHQLLPMMQALPLRPMVDLTPPQWPTTPQPHVHWQEEVKAGLDRGVRLGVIEPVPVGDPVTYCHRMVIRAKKDGKPRRTVDMQSLNTNATRETHHTQSPFHQARSVPAGMKKTVFDAWNGYHSVALHPDDRHLTTFITPWGDTAIESRLKVMLLLVTAIHGASTTLPQTSRTKLSVSMTLS